MRRTAPLSLLLLVAALLATLPAAASAAELLNQTVSIASNGATSCAAKPASGAGLAQRRVTLPAGGLVSAKLTAASGDWDVAIFEAANGRVVSSGAAFGANELASGFVTGPRELIVQACRRKGGARTARLHVTSVDLSGEASPVKASLLKVRTPTREDKARLQSLDLDLTEHAGHDYIEVVAYGEEDRKRLRDAGFSFDVSVADLVKTDLDRALSDRKFARATKRSALPSGRDQYRRLGEIEAELKSLAERFPTLAKPITLNHKSLEGRDVTGIEVTENAGNVGDGKPVFFQMGVHHAREWPSAEMPMEFANELLNGYGSNERITRLLKEVRVIFVPVVNVDGFNISREAPVDLLNDPAYSQIPDSGAGVDGVFLQGAAQNAYLIDPFFNYKRRNCRLAPGQAPPPGLCATPPFRTSGVDPNRNYGGLWGGFGASAIPAYDTYRGEGPFSEPETQNVKELVSERQVTNLITNHTFSALVLRPPGVRAQGPTPDEPAYKALGDAMAAQNGYFSDFSYGLYDTSGTTEDWTYFATGGFGFTYEIGPDTVEQQCGGFHPPYACVVRQYEVGINDGGGGNREAYMIMLEHAANAKNHSELTGEAPAGVTLRLKKEFVSETSPVREFETDAPVVEGNPTPVSDPIKFNDVLNTTMTVPQDGKFKWGINPSTRPAVQANRYRTVSEEPTRTVEFAKTKETTPNPSGEAYTEANYEDHPFTINADEDGRTAIVSVTGTGADDYDIVVYKVVNGAPQEIGSDGAPPGSVEEVVIENARAGDYIVRVNNYLGVGPYSGTVDVYGLGEEVVKVGTVEAWTLTCEVGDTILSSQKVTVARGESLNLAEVCGANAREVAAAAFAAQGQPLPSGLQGATPVACASRAGFRSAAARARGKNVQLAFARRQAEPVQIDVFQVSKGRTVLTERRVARFRNLTKSLTWDGRGNDGKPISDGVFFVRFRTEGKGRRDSRRVVLVRKNGRFFARRTHHRPASCGFLYSAKLRRPVFGGRQRKPLQGAFRVNRASRVTVSILRGKRVVTRVRISAKRNRLHRFKVPQRRLKIKGLYTVRIAARAGGRRATATLVSERL